VRQDKSSEIDFVASAAVQLADKSKYRARRRLAALEKNGRSADQNVDVSPAG
jgi:hypothetical protein